MQPIAAPCDSMSLPQGARADRTPEDRGAGVLNRFHRLDRSRLDGAGPRLAIVSTTMTLHGGAVRVEDAPGRGVRIRLVFPNTDR